MPREAKVDYEAWFQRIQRRFEQAKEEMWKTAAICPVCFDKRYPGREPFRLKDPEAERCIDCGLETVSGIYIRVEVPPREDKP